MIVRHHRENSWVASAAKGEGKLQIGETKRIVT